MDFTLLQYVVMTLLLATALYRSKTWRLTRLRDPVYIALFGMGYFLSLFLYVVTTAGPRELDSFTPQDIARYLGLIILPFVVLYLYSFTDSWEKKHASAPRTERLVGGLLFVVFFLATFANNTDLDAALIGTSGVLLKVAFACFVALVNVPLIFMIIGSVGRLITVVWHADLSGIAAVRGRAEEYLMLTFLILGYGCLIAAMV